MWIKKNKKYRRRNRQVKGQAVCSQFGLPVLAAQNLFISVWDSSKLLLPLLLFLLLLLGQSPFEVLYHSVFLLLWSVTLTLLARIRQKVNHSKNVSAKPNQLRKESNLREKGKKK